MDAGSYRYGKNTPTTEEKASPLEQESKEPSSYNLRLNNPGSKVVQVTDEEIDKMLLSLSNAITLANDCRKMEEQEPEDNLVLERRDKLGGEKERETTKLLAKENLVKVQNNLQESGLEQQEDSLKTEPLQSVDSEISLEDLVREKYKRDVCLAREVNEKPKKYTQKSEQLSTLKIKLEETKALHSDEVKKNSKLRVENDQQKAEIQRLKDLLKSKEQHIVEFGNQSVKQFPTAEPLATENNTQTQEPAAETGKVQVALPSLSERTRRLIRERTGKEVCLTGEKLEGESCKTLGQEVRQELTINTKDTLRARTDANLTDMSEKTVLMKNELEKQNHEQKNEIQQLKMLVSHLYSKENKHLETISNLKKENNRLQDKILMLLQNNVDSLPGQHTEIKVENDDKKQNSNIQVLEEPLEDRISISNSEESSRQEMDLMETNISERSLMHKLDSKEIDEQEIDEQEIDEQEIDEQEIDEQEIDEQEIDEQEIIPSNSQNNGEDTSGKWKNRLLIGGGFVAAAAAFCKYGPATMASNVMSIFNPNNYVGTWI